MHDIVTMVILVMIVRAGKAAKRGTIPMRKLTAVSFRSAAG